MSLVICLNAGKPCESNSHNVYFCIFKNLIVMHCLHKKNSLNQLKIIIRITFKIIIININNLTIYNNLKYIIRVFQLNCLLFLMK